MDAIDTAILDLLQREGRLSNKALAARIGLSQSACSERLRRLQREKVVERYVAVVSRQALGNAFEAWIAIELPHRTRAAVETLARAVEQADIVVAAYELAGPFDILLHVVAPNLGDWRLLEQAIERRLGKKGNIRLNVVVCALKALSPISARIIALSNTEETKQINAKGGSAGA